MNLKKFSLLYLTVFCLLLCVEADSRAVDLNKNLLQREFSSSDQVVQIKGSAKLKVNDIPTKKSSFFLYGAEHLKLSNYCFDIPVVYNEHVKKWLKYFLTRGRNLFIRYGGRAGRYAPIMGKILEDQGVPRDLIFLAMAESGFSNRAKSRALAIGPWQFIKYTGKKFGLKIDFYVDERKDPLKATVAASRYLKRLYDEFDSWELALAGYNAGEGKVRRAIRKYKTKNFWKIIKGRYLRAETENYVPKIMALAIIGKNLKSFNMEEIDFMKGLNFHEILLAENTDLLRLADDIGLPFEEIQRYNPELLRWHTPPNINPYRLRLPILPINYKKVYNECCKSKDYKAKDFQIYKVKGRYGETLAGIARRYRLRPSILIELNKLGSKKFLKKGTEIFLPFRIGQMPRDSMYADLYDKPIKRIRKRRKYKTRIRLGKKRGKEIKQPKSYYIVKKGDTLWNVSKKIGISLDTLIKSNYQLVSSRMIREGDKLVVR